MAKLGLVAARITVPTGGWALSLTVTGGTGGTTTVTLPAGTYWIADLLAALKTALDAAFGADGVFTCSIAISEGGTLFVTISHATETFSITWTAPELGNLLGFAGNLTPAALSFTGTERCEALWQSDCPYDAPRGQTTGILQRDRTVAVAADGTMSGHGFVSRRKLGRVVWTMVGVKRTLQQYETVTNESFERWFNNTHLGAVTYFGAVPMVRFYWDADSLGTYVQLKLTEPVDEFNPQRVDSLWIGLWPVAIDGWVQT